ncbi:4'-phosphopantetheinyl transferase family protein [Magnetococcales bacterium HHB-1]
MFWYTRLSDEEKKRAKRFRFEKDRHAFILSHGAMRACLAIHLKCAPELIQFKTGSHGKPALVAEKTPYRFNLSHAHGWAILAISLNHAVGVDLEKIRRLDSLLDLAHRFFSVAERESLEKLSGSALKEAFFSCWSRKEAYIKQHGLGLSLPLDGFTVTTRTDDPERILLKTDWKPEDINHSRIYDIFAPEGYCAALCVASLEKQKLHCFHFGSLDKSVG